ncbi:MAG TPA: cold shock and DUF1294 domain-containing protein [Pseudomonadales bacterium]
MPLIGKIVKWDDDKGFGFIQPASGGRQAFVHVSALRRIPRSAVPGAEVSYVVTLDARGRPCADKVRLLARTNTLGSAARAFFTAAIFLLLLAALVALRRIPSVIPWAYLGMSVLSLLFYAFDKHAAREGNRRTPESTLHLLALAGGWPGALFAQQWLRHKSAKAEFRSVFWTTVVLNVAALAYLTTTDGARLLASVGMAP